LHEYILLPTLLAEVDAASFAETAEFKSLFEVTS